MAEQDNSGVNYDAFPRDQVEHFKVELSRLRAENDRLLSEVDYLRQALAATLSKIPQIEAATSPVSVQPPRTRPWEQSSVPLKTYIGYFSLASLIASPMALLTIVMLGLICGLLSFGFYIVVTL
jgi:hypothetical protein